MTKRNKHKLAQTIKKIQGRRKHIKKSPSPTTMQQISQQGQPTEKISREASEKANKWLDELLQED